MHVVTSAIPDPAAVIQRGRLTVLVLREGLIPSSVVSLLDRLLRHVSCSLPAEAEDTPTRAQAS